MLGYVHIQGKLWWRLAATHTSNFHVFAQLDMVMKVVVSERGRSDSKDCKLHSRRTMQGETTREARTDSVYSRFACSNELEMVLCQNLDSGKCRSILVNCAFKENVGGCSQRNTHADAWCTFTFLTSTHEHTAHADLTFAISASGLS